MHEALMTVYGECHHGEGAADCTTVVAAFAAYAATPEAAPEDDTRFHRPNFRGDHCAQCRESWPCPWATPEAAPED